MRTIDADALKMDLNDPPLYLSLGGMSIKDALDLIDIQPTIDAVPVVRCKDCKYGEWDESIDDYYCGDLGAYFEGGGMGFCSDGERKNDDIR